MTTLEDSYRRCRRVARSRARNFYYSFLLLPRLKRDAMCAVYAFMRVCDDLSDEELPGGLPAQRAALDSWRADLDRALSADVPDHWLWPAFADSVRRYRIPSRYFHEMIDGVLSDLSPRRIASFDDLYGYCYHVASVVGLTITHIFGFSDPRALPLAEKCGIAFQLTNILRDVEEDSRLGRNYLPEDDLRAFGRDAVLRDLGRRAGAYYEESQPLVQLVDRDSRAALWALIEIYRRLFQKIAASGYDVFHGRVRLSSLQKSAIVVRALLRPAQARPASPGFPAP